MPTWVPGNKPAPRPRGFTLLELLIVVALIAVASAVASLALPDPAHTRLEQEAARLATLLEAGRAQSRALGVPVYWVPGPAGGAALDGRPVDDFHFAGLPEGHGLPQRWLAAPGAEAVQIRLSPTRRALLLGPEPIIGAQRVELLLAGRSLVLASDGLGPFRITDDAPRP